MGEPGGRALPGWPLRSAGFLIASGPHAIPVSTAVRARGDRLLFALARRRATLERLREDPRAAFALLAEGVAFTAYGEVQLTREPLRCTESVAALAMRVERVQDHLATSRTEIVSSVGWRWTSEEASAADREVVDELVALAAEWGAPSA